MVATNGNGSNGASAQTTALAVRDGTTAIAPRKEFDRLAFEPDNWEQAIKVTALLYKSGLLPSSVKSPEAALAIVMRGRELGMTAMQSLTSIHVIEGKTGMSADLMVARVLESGKAEFFDLVESSSEKATYVTCRKGRQREVTMTWTIQDAQRAGVATKDVWRKYPAAMLRHRASSDLARAVYPEVVLGLYDPDEITAEPAPVKDPEVARVEDAKIGASIEQLRKDVNAAASAIAPAMFERIVGQSHAAVMAGPAAGLRHAREKLLAAGAVASTAKATVDTVIDVTPEVSVSVERPIEKPAAIATVADAEDVPEPDDEPEAEDPAPKAEPSTKVDEVVNRIKSAFDMAPTPKTEPAAEPKPAPVARGEITVAMLSTANGAARKVSIVRATEVWKRHCAGRNPTALTNDERIALVVELEAIAAGGAS